MEIEHREGQSVYLRGWGDYQRYSLKLTESKLPGLGHMAIRAWSPRGAGAPRRGDRADRSRQRLDRRRSRPRSRVPVHRPRRPRDSSSTTRPSATSRPSTCARAEERAPALHAAAAPPSSASTTSTCSPPTWRPTARFAQEQLGYRLYEQIIHDDGTEPGAWMSLTIAAHELIYVADHAGGQRPPAPPRVLRRHARGAACAPPTSSSTPTSRSRPRRPSTRSPRACSSTCTSPAATASR